MSGYGYTLHAGHADELVRLVGERHRVAHVTLVVADARERDHRRVAVVNTNRNIDLEQTINTTMSKKQTSI